MNRPFSTKSPGIGGRIKARYSDFVVEEIPLDNRICEVNLDQVNQEQPLVVSPVPEDTRQRQLQVDLQKTNCDLNFVIDKIARYLQISKKRIGYAGLKDKRGITCQRISIFDPPAARVESFLPRGFLLKNPQWTNTRLEIGDLRSNRFRITIRNVQKTEDEIRRAFGAFKTEATQNGIANYFGEQRFGGNREVTHLVGKAILQGDFDSAVMTYLTHESAGEDEDLARVRRDLASDRDFKKAVRAFPPFCRVERTLASHLGQFPRDTAGALSKLPKGMRFLFTHAYQAHLFNALLAKRIESGAGLKPLAGDQLSENKIVEFPLPGYETELSEGPTKKDLVELLAAEGIMLSQFKVTRGLPEATSRGAWKEIALFPKDVELVKIEADAFFENARAVILRFELPKGCYATTVIDEFCKNDAK